MSLKRLLPVALIFVVSASCFAQTLLFSSGFEPNTTLSSINFGMDGAGHWLSFSGTDNSTGQSWTNPPFTANYWGARVETVSISGTPSATGYFVDEIDTTASDCHSGSQCLYLEIGDIPSGTCCAQQPGPGVASLTQTINEFYERFWMKYPSSYLTSVENANSYEADSITYWKTADDYRIEPDIFVTSGVDYFRGHLQSDTGGIGATCPYYDPTTLATEAPGGNCTNFTYANIDNDEYQVPAGSWFLVEFYFKRSVNPDGRIFLAIGCAGLTSSGCTSSGMHVIGDYTGITMGPYGQAIEDFGFMQQYNDGVYPEPKWLDDWQIWSTIPCAALPCGYATSGGGSPAATPPTSPTSYAGAIGAVGVPFSYQLTGTNSPTEFQAGSLPAGLSLNTSTGLISGTPTAAGITGPSQFNMLNGSGKGGQMLEFNITSSVQVPSIAYFWCNPCTTPATLKWVTMGAGTVSLSINNGVGTVSGPNGSVSVSPSSNTTYTLTAANSAGSTTTTAFGNAATATVTVGSGNSPSPPSSLTATVQ